MAFPLSLPAIGSTNWGTAVNNNWATINSAFSTSAPFSGTVIIGTDPGGTAALRIGGNAYSNGSVFAGFENSAPTDFPTAALNGYANANSPGLISYSNGSGGAPATSGTSQTASALVTRFGLANVILDFGIRSNGNVWLQTGFYSALGTTFPMELNPIGGGVIVGTDPGGTAALRVGGNITSGGGLIMVSTNSGSYTAAQLTANSTAAISVDGAAQPYIISINSSGGVDSKIFDIYATTTSINHRFINDAYTTGTTWLSATRSGTTVTKIYLGGTSIPTSSFTGNVIWGNQDGTTGASAGQVGEILSSGVSTYSNLGSTNPVSMTSLSLTAGYWLCTATITFLKGGTVGTGNYILAVNTTSNSLAGVVEGESIVYDYSAFTTANKKSLTLTFPVNIASTTTYYLNAQCTAFSAGQAACWLQFVRIR